LESGGEWSNAIALMKAVPATNPNKALAQTKIAEYQRNLTYAKQQATCPIQQKPDSVVDFPEMPPLRASNICCRSAADAIKPNGVSSQNQTPR